MQFNHIQISEVALRTMFALVSGLIWVGCGSSYERDVDGGSDAARDGGIVIDNSVPPPDDATIIITDDLGIPDAPPAPRCGDRAIDVGEICDDGNNISGDGCRGDCLSNEMCGNNVVDFVRGEVCDSSPGCAADCRSVTICGDGTTSAGETCDDSNIMSFDGCGRDCVREYAMFAQMLTIAEQSAACDLNGDNRPDSAFARSFGSSLALVNSFLGMGGGGGGVGQILLALSGLRDVANSGVRVGWLTPAGADAQGNTFVASAGINAMGNPTTAFDGRVLASVLTAGPQDVVVSVGPLPLSLSRAQIRGNLRPVGQDQMALNNGKLCGGIVARSLAAIPTSIIPIGMQRPACDGSSSPTMLDGIAGGGTLAIIPLTAVAPDVDVDGDGLERFEIRRGSTCAPVIVACIDGNGTRIEGHNCVNDPRIADGFSVAFTFTGQPIRLGGVR